MNIWYENAIIFKAKEYIEKHYCTDFSMNDVAKAVSLSPHYFSRLFKRETGLTFLEFLTQKRIDRAKQLLRDPGLTINEVAQSVGYSEACYFSRVFKKSENISPSEYREKFFKSPGIISTVNL